MTGPYVIKLVQLGSGIFGPQEEDGLYLKEYTPHGYEGVGRLVATADVEDAMYFADVVEALSLWKAVSDTHPIRLDGKPNRPLSAWTVEVLPLSKERGDTA